MVFTHDTDVALQTAAALVNTAEGAGAQDDGDTLSTPEQLRDFYVGWGWTGRFDGDAAELEQARALRPRLRAVWQAADDPVATVALVNDLLRTGGHGHDERGPGDAGGDERSGGPARLEQRRAKGPRRAEGRRGEEGDEQPEGEGGPRCGRGGGWHCCSWRHESRNLLVMTLDPPIVRSQHGLHP